MTEKQNADGSKLYGKDGQTGFHAHRYHVFSVHDAADRS